MPIYNTHFHLVTQLSSANYILYYAMWGFYNSKRSSKFLNKEKEVLEDVTKKFPWIILMEEEYF